MRWRGRRQSENIEDRRGFNAGTLEACDSFREAEL